MKNHSEGSFQSDDGTSLYYQVWKPDPDVRANKPVLAVVHGGGEHSGRYLNLVEYFVPRGNPVYAFDLRGHGKSEGKRGHILRFDDYLADTDAFLNLVRRLEPNRKVFLVGHSLGGLITAAYALDHPQLAGLILSSPFFQIKIAVPHWKTAMGRMVSSLLPGLTFKSGIDIDGLSHDPEVAVNYRNDSLVHGNVTARLYTEIVRMQSQTLQRAGNLEIPLLLCYGGQDGIADPPGASRFYRGISFKDKTSHCYDGCYHEIFNEVNKQDVFNDIEAWIKKHAHKDPNPYGERRSITA
jgi:alpha-beta hydrolase superfamily lysophospholipase